MQLIPTDSFPFTYARFRNQNYDSLVVFKGIGELGVLACCGTIPIYVISVYFPNEGHTVIRSGPQTPCIGQFRYHVNLSELFIQNIVN